MADKFSHHPATISLAALETFIRQTERLEFKLILLGFTDDSGQPLNVSAYDSVDTVPPEIHLQADDASAADSAKQETLKQSLRQRGGDVVSSAVLRLEDNATFVVAYRGVLAEQGAGGGPVLGSTEYDQLFTACKIRPERQAAADKIVDRITARRADYENVAAQTGSPGVPWYVIACIHSLESDLDFDTHLHNGDSLRRRTVNDPGGRPPRPPRSGALPYTWEESALDALEHDGALRQTDWTIGGILGFLERFNGLGYRRLGIKTPYLWSFSNHYTAGKFVADGVFSSTAVSAQCGAAVILKRLIERNVVSGLPTQPGPITPGGQTPAQQPPTLIARTMRGPHVARLQQMLRGGGFFRDVVDGDFGPITEASVRLFQKAAGLESNGVVDDSVFKVIEGGKVPRIEIVPERRGSTLAEQIASFAEQEATKNLRWDGPHSDAERLYLAPMRPAMRELGHVGNEIVFFNWCACWVTFVLRQIGLKVPDQPPGFFATVALVDAVEHWAKSNGTYFAKGTRSPQRGDIVFFQFDADEAEDHIGIVREVSSSNVVLTAEGNRGNRSGNFERRMATASGFMRLL